MFYVYILQSIKDKRYYIGYTQDLNRRIEDHNRGKSRSVKVRAPFVLIYYETYPNRLQAIQRERQIKSYKGGEGFKKLIYSNPKE